MSEGSRTPAGLGVTRAPCGDQVQGLPVTGTLHLGLSALGSQPVPKVQGVSFRGLSTCHWVAGTRITGQ